MWTNYKAIGSYLAVALSFTATVSAEKVYIIGKKEDETLLIMSIAFVAVCGIFLLVSIMLSLMLLRRTRSKYGGRRGYQMEQEELRYQSMYRSSKHDGDMSPSSIEQFKLNDTINGVYESIDKSSEKQDNNMAKKSTPPGTEKGQKDTKETEKKTRALSSFHNPAYQSNSMHSGLDQVVVDVKPTSEAHDNDTAL